METIIKEHYRKYSRDRSITSAELKRTIEDVHGKIDEVGAQRLLIDIVAPDGVMTEEKFLNGILRYLGRLPPKTTAFDYEKARADLASYYTRACADGIVETKEVQAAATMFSVRCDMTIAAGLIQSIAGPERRITQAKFVETILDYVCRQKGLPPPPPPGMGLPASAPGMGYPAPFDPIRARGELSSFYSVACADGIVDTKEVQQAVGKFGVVCDPPTAHGLIQSIAGPDPRITEPKFVETLLHYICMRKGLPPPPPPAMPADFHQPPPPAGIITAGPNANAPDPAVAAYLSSYYDGAAGDGVIDTTEVIRACEAFHVGCDAAGARQLLQIVAAPDNRITKDKFVKHIGIYITRYK